jgi:hypothetical protein
MTITVVCCIASFQQVVTYVRVNKLVSDDSRTNYQTTWLDVTTKPDLSNHFRSYVATS